jgi:hypothetical protein
MGEDSFTIIATSRPDEIRTGIAAWTAQGLLGSSIWVDPARQSESVTVMAMPVLLVDANGTRELPLREVFGDTAVRLVRVLAVQPVTDDSGGDGELIRGLWEFSRELAGKLAQRTVLQRINLLVPNSGEITAKSLFEPDCDLNVVVSPEDRPHERAIDHGLDRGEVFDAHCAFACATVGALWRATGTGAFDQLDGMRGGRRGAIVVTRAMARTIDGRLLPDKIVSRLLTDGAGSLRKYRTDDPNRVFDDDRLVKFAAGRFCLIENEVLSYREPPREPQRPARKIVPKTLRMLLRFFLHLTRVKLVEWRRGSVQHLNRDAEQWLREQEPEKLTGRSVWMTPEELQEVAATAPAMTQEANPLMPAVPPVYPYVWPPLRQLCLGLVDEGALPPEIQTELGTLAPTVHDPRSVAAHPDALFQLQPEERKLLADRGLPARDIRPGDSCATARLEADLDGFETDWPNVHKEDKRVIVVCRERLKNWTEQTKGDGSLVGRLVRHVGEQIEVARVALKRRRRDYLREEEEYRKVLAGLDKIREKLWYHVGMIVAMVLAMVGWATSALLTDSSPFVVVFTILAASGTVGFVAWFGVLSAVAAEAAAFEQQVEDIEARRRVTVAAVREWPTEVQRLGGLYEILLDWGEAIGYLLHRPFGATSAPHATDEDHQPRRPEAFKAGRAESSEAQYDDLAARVVKEVFTNGWISRLYDVVLDAVIPGREEPFSPDAANSPDYAPSPFRPEDRLPDDHEDVPSAGAEKTEPAPEEKPASEEGSDTPEPVDDAPPPHARERLLRGFRSNDYSLSARTHVRASIRKALLSLPPERLFSTVAVPVQDPGGNQNEVPKTVEAKRFLNDVLPDWTAHAAGRLAPTVFSDFGRIGSRETVAQTHLWGVVDHLTMPEQVPRHVWVHAEPGRSANPEDHQYQFSLIRLDVSEGCEEGDLVFPN